MFTVALDRTVTVSEVRITASYAATVGTERVSPLLPFLVLHHPFLPPYPPPQIVPPPPLPMRAFANDLHLTLIVRMHV
jgi:hypothetical protein